MTEDTGDFPIPGAGAEVSRTDRGIVFGGFGRAAELRKHQERHVQFLRHLRAGGFQDAPFAVGQARQDRRRIDTIEPLPGVMVLAVVGVGRGRSRAPPGGRLPGSREQVDELVTTVMERFGRIDVLVNNPAS